MNQENTTVLAEILFRGRPVIYIKSGGNFLTTDKKTGKQKIIQRAKLIPVRYPFKEFLENLCVIIPFEVFNKDNEFLRIDRRVLTVKSVIKKIVKDLKHKDNKDVSTIERIGIKQLNNYLNKKYCDYDTKTALFNVRIYE